MTDHVPKTAFEHMTLNEAAFHLDYYLTELRDNHTAILRMILREFAGVSVNEELLLFDRAAAAIRALARQGKGVLQVDPEKGCDIVFRSCIPMTNTENAGGSDANLAEQLALVKRLQKEIDKDMEGDGPPLDKADVSRLTDLVDALDNWLCKGGYLPKRWR